jgi:hypothetical protein
MMSVASSVTWVSGNAHSRWHGWGFDVCRSWIRKTGGKPTTRKLTPEQEQRYRPWFNNNRRLQDLVAELVAELQAQSIQAIEAAEGWQTRRPNDHESAA